MFATSCSIADPEQLSMAIVVFSSELQKLTGEEQTRVEATVFRDIVDEISEKYPGLDQEKLFDMAIAIDGVIIHTPLLETLDAESELHFLHRISGG